MVSERNTPTCFEQVKVPHSTQRVQKMHLEGYAQFHVQRTVGKNNEIKTLPPDFWHWLLFFSFSFSNNYLIALGRRESGTEEEEEGVEFLVTQREKADQEKKDNGNSLLPLSLSHACVFLLLLPFMID